MNLGVICCHTGNLISILFKSTGIYLNIIYVTKAIVTSLTDKNSNKGKTKCRSKYWPIRVVKSNSAILPKRKIKEKKFPWIQMIRIRKFTEIFYSLLSIDVSKWKTEKYNNNKFLHKDIVIDVRLIYKIYILQRRSWSKLHFFRKMQK